MATLILRNQKGSPLTNTEVDGNFTALNTDITSLQTSVSSNTTSITNANLAGFSLGTTNPTGTTRLNYNGNFYPTALNLVGTGDTTATATHYFVETSTDGFIRPKTLANVQSEIVTTASVNSALATSLGTVTTGVWNAGAVTSTGDILSSKSSGQLATVGGSGSSWSKSFFRNDGTGVYLLLSDIQTTQTLANAATYNTLRPLSINTSTGSLIIDGTGAGTTFNGPVNVNNGPVNVQSLKFTSMTNPIFAANIDFGNNNANTWLKIVGATLANQTYSTIAFKIDVVDPNANHGVPISTSPDIETYYVTCDRADGATLDSPDMCYVHGPGNRIRAVKTATGTYEIQIQNEAQFREYDIRISVYTSNGSHSVNYFNGATAGTAIATYDATVGGSINHFENIRIAGGSPASGKVLTSDDTGNASWQTISSGGSTFTIADDNITNATYYPTFSTATSGTISTAKVSSTKLTFNPSTGQLNATSFNSTSDARLKTDVATITNPFDVISKLSGKTFKYIDNNKNSAGLIAQELEQVLPDAVSDRGDGYLSVNYNMLVPYLIEVVKEQQKIIESLMVRVESLENK